MRDLPQAVAAIYMEQLLQHCDALHNQQQAPVVQAAPAVQTVQVEAPVLPWGMGAAAPVTAAAPAAWTPAAVTDVTAAGKAAMLAPAATPYYTQAVAVGGGYGGYAPAGGAAAGSPPAEEDEVDVDDLVALCLGD